MPFPRASQALSRFTVLDLTRVRSGPTCVRQLADWGTNVIKIDALMEDAAGEQPGASSIRASILMTLVPQSASCRTQVGPERTRVRSSTVKRDRACEARGKACLLYT